MIEFNKPMLSICIPTYNRLEFLKRTIDIILPQIALLQGKVNLFISDNNSNDGTYEYCRELESHNKNVTYFQQEENLGPDVNILNSYHLATGVFAWILGDDDIIAPGSIPKLLSILSENQDVALCYLNPTAIDKLNFKNGNEIKLTEHTNKSLFSRNVGIMFTFISSVVVNKDYVESLGGVDGEYLGSNLVQLSWVFSALSFGNKFLYIESNLVGVEHNNTGGYKLFSVFGPQFVDIVDDKFIHDKALNRNLKLSSMYFLLKIHISCENVSNFHHEDVGKVTDIAFEDLYIYRLIFKQLFHKNDYAKVCSILFRVSFKFVDMVNHASLFLRNKLG